MNKLSFHLRYVHETLDLYAERASNFCTIYHLTDDISALHPKFEQYGYH